MVDLISRNLPQIRKLCKKYQIARLWLFGSALDEQEFSQNSDVDFLYEFNVKEGYDPEFPYAANWSDLLTALKTLLNREVQLIPYQDFRNPWFKVSVEATKKLIYEAEATEMVK